MCKRRKSIKGRKKNDEQEIKSIPCLKDVDQDYAIGIDAP